MADIKLGPMPTKTFRAKRVAQKIGRGFLITGRAINKSSKAVGRGVAKGRQGVYETREKYRRAESRYLSYREEEAEKKLERERKLFAIREKEKQARNLKKKRKGPGKSYSYSPFG